MLKIISTFDYNERQQAAQELNRLCTEEGWQCSVKRTESSQEIVLLQPPSSKLEDIIVANDLVSALQKKREMYG